MSAGSCGLLPEVVPCTPTNSHNKLTGTAKQLYSVGRIMLHAFLKSIMLFYCAQIVSIILSKSTQDSPTTTLLRPTSRLHGSCAVPLAIMWGLHQCYSKKWNVVVIRGFSCMNEWLKCMESQMLLKNFLYSLEHCIAPMQGPVWFQSYRKQHL